MKSNKDKELGHHGISRKQVEENKAFLAKCKNFNVKSPDKRWRRTLDNTNPVQRTLIAPATNARGDLKAAVRPYHNPNTGMLFASFNDKAREELMDEIQRQGRAIFKYKTPMQDTAKKGVFMKTPSEDDLARYAIDLEGATIMTRTGQFLSGGRKDASTHQMW